MRRYLGLALACVLAAISFSAWAMGLGEIRLNSYLNQRLDAEIELVSAAADEIESLEVGLADRAAFERYGLQRDALLNNLQFEVIRRPNGTAYVKVTSTEPVREPFLTLLVVADWSSGRLMREYTLLIDPPAFASQEQAEPAPAPQAPSVTQAERPAQPIQREEPVVAGAGQPARTDTTETQTGDVISIPPLEADAEPATRVRREPAYAQTGPDNYGPIQRNETLWGIARRLRPDETITVNQMMLALYHANPEAFQGNINRMKAGYILRIPGYNEITSLARGEAFNEVKRQNDEWRMSATTATPSPRPAEPAEAAPTAEPELSLVAPDEELEPEVGTGVGAGGEAGDLGLGSEDPLDLAEDDVEEGAMDLGVEDETSDRLLDLEDESMQALQEQEDATPAEDAPGETEAVEPPPLATGETAADPSRQSEAGAEETPEEGAAVTEPVPEQDPRMAAPVPRQPEPGLLDTLRNAALSPLGLGIGAAILVLLLAGFLVFRKRREAAQAQAAAAMEDWGDETDGEVAVEDRDDIAMTSDRDEGGGMATVFGHEETGQDEDEAKTRFHEAGTPFAPQEQDDGKTGDEFVDTMVGEKAVTLDENDPLSEADFHMAYGLYDQAAEVVQKAVEREPARKDYHAKLAEIHFAGNNTEGFLESARRLKELSGPGDTDWENVAIMGRQIASDDPMFADGGTTSSVDLDFGTAAEEVADGPAPTTESAGESAGADDDSLDFDISLDDASPASEPEAAAEGPETDDRSEALDFDLDTGTADKNASAGEAAGTATDESADFDFDLGELETETSSGSDEPPARESAEAPAESYTDDEQTQTEFDKALQELSAFVDTNVPEQDVGDAAPASDEDSGLNLEDYSFDEDDSALEEAAGTGEDEEDIGEVGTKLDLARAYIDMGDPDGARGILEEVVTDGDEEQQREARELLDQLS